MESANFYRNKRVLVAGAGGFIGSHLVGQLLGRGAVVIAVNSPQGDAWRLKDCAHRIESIRADLQAVGEAARVMAASRPDVIFNLASSLDTRRSLENANEIIAGTYGIAEALLSVAHEREVPAFVQVGSIEEYGAGETPFVESQREIALSPYGLGKIMATQHALMLARLSPMRISVARPAATYGPAQNFGMLTPNFIKACIERRDFVMNPGEQLRDFMYVEDLATGLLAIGSEEKAQGEIVNLGSGKPVMVKEVVELINRAMGEPIHIEFGAQPYRPGDAMEFYMNTEKAHRLLHWKPKVSLEEGIAQTAAWYQEHFKEISL